MRLNWILLLTVVVTSAAEARPRLFNRATYTPQSVPTSAMPMVTTPAVAVTTPTTIVPATGVMPATAVMPSSPVQTVGGGLAQSKAETQARSGRCFHPGGSLGGGSYEGCGFSTVSADDAIRHCCYWGQRTPIDIGVARGSNGWYATVLYR